MKKLLFIAILFPTIVAAQTQNTFPATQTDNTFTNNMRFKGTDPWADVTAFGAKAVVQAGITTTATCSGTTCTLGAAVFNNGDGITIRGAGATNTMGTPAAPSVTPSLATVSTVPDAPSIMGANSPTGATTYAYKVIARDQFGALTAPSAATTITNGLASLGLQTLTVATLSRSGAIVTVATTGTQNLSINALVHIYGSTNAQFTGYFNVATVNNGGNSFTITKTPMDTTYGAASSATDGFVSYYTSNKITWAQPTGTPWEYYLCGSRPADSGAYHLIGTSAPTQQTGNKYTITSFFDFGSTMNGNQTYPPYVTDAACTGSATNDPLTTTVLAGGKTTTIILPSATPVINAVTGATAVYDACLNITAAVNSINGVAGFGGTVYFPPAGTNLYPINSYCKIPSYINVLQSGRIVANETIELNTNTNWNGSWGIANTIGTFSFDSRAQTICQYANPCFYSNASGNGTYQDMNVYGFAPSTANGSTLWLTDDAYELTWDHVGMTTNQETTTDRVGKALVLRSTQSGGDRYHFTADSFFGGPSGTIDDSWSPLIYIPVSLNSSQVPQQNNTLIDAITLSFNHRGIEWDLDGGTFDCDFRWAYRQGGIDPFFTFGNAAGSPGGICSMDHLIVDTEVQPVFANLGGGVNDVYVRLTQSESESSEAGGVPPVISGSLAYNVIYDQFLGTRTLSAGVQPYSTQGTCILGTSCSVTLTAPLTFSTSTSYVCVARDTTTPSNVVTVTQTSGIAVAFTGTGTDGVAYVCSGI